MTQAATSKVENSAQGSSCNLKFVHGWSQFSPFPDCPWREYAFCSCLLKLFNRRRCIKRMPMLLYVLKFHHYFVVLLCRARWPLNLLHKKCVLISIHGLYWVVSFKNHRIYLHPKILLCVLSYIYQYSKHFQLFIETIKHKTLYQKNADAAVCSKICWLFCDTT